MRHFFFALSPLLAAISVAQVHTTKPVPVGDITTQSVMGGELAILTVKADDVLDGSGKSLRKFRRMLPRDGALRIVNDSGKDVRIMRTIGEDTAELMLKNGFRADFGSEDMKLRVQVMDGDDARFGFDFTLMVARKLGVLTRVGASLFGSADSGSTYKLFTNQEGEQEIERGDTRGFDANLSGLIYVPFDDEFILKSRLFNPEHHRFGLMVGIGAGTDTDLNYQVGLAWFLDREAKAVVSLGVMWRRSENLLDGLKPGDVWDQPGPLPVRRTWRPSLFIGLSFNLGD